jgi:hypothetical protein
MSFNFWQKWLVGVGVYHVVFGLVLAFFGQSALMDMLINQYYDPIFWPDNEVSQGATHYKNWSTSVLGSVVASWGIFIAFLAYYPFKLRGKMGVVLYLRGGYALVRRRHRLVALLPRHHQCGI